MFVIQNSGDMLLFEPKPRVMAKQTEHWAAGDHVLKPETDFATANTDESMRVGRQSLTLRERAADVIRKAIIDHRLPPGKHLKERELCEMLGVSRTSVREALRHLESEQLIETVPHRGPVVVSLTVDDAKDLYKVRAALEGLVGELFASNASDQQIAELSRIADKMSVAAHEDQADVTLSIVADFYRVLFDGANNQVCAQFIQSLNTRVSMFRRLSLSSDRRPETMMKEVEKIVAAAVARDPQALKQACIDHVEGACAAVMQRLSSEEENQNRPN